MSLRGRFGKDLDDRVKRYTVSVPFDRRLYKQDIAGSIAHARMLAKQGIITIKEVETIITGLVSIRKEIEAGEFEFKEELEDIHMNIEARLVEKTGEAGEKLHREAVSDAVSGLKALQRALLEVAEPYRRLAMPGYTHMQRAQPVLFAHHLLAYFEMFQRDIGRFRACHERADVLPLGSGALAGVPYSTDREFLAAELGFSRISANSMDAVSDREWSTTEFSFVELDDAFSTGSSMMPQKRNPDVAELARGKTGRVYGHLMAALTTLKGLPLTYNRDLQEDKEGLFDSVDTLLSTLGVMAPMVASLRVRTDRISRAAEADYTLATDIADYLVRKGIPFRQAHGIVGSLVRYAVEIGKPLHDLDLIEYRRFCPEFENDVKSITLESSLAARNVPGGTAPEEVEKALAAARRTLDGA